jgi:hypothetical protein
MAQYNTITAAEYKEIRDVIVKVLGKTSNQSIFGGTDDDFGYGQELVSANRDVANLITASDWEALTKDMLRVLYHQNGTNFSADFASTENVLVGDELGNSNLTAVTSGFPYVATAVTTITATSAINNYITVNSTANMNIGMQIVFENQAYTGGSTFGGITLGTTYYIFNIIQNISAIQISTVSPSSSTTALVLTSATVPPNQIKATASGSKGQFILEKDRKKMWDYTKGTTSINISTITNRFKVYQLAGNGTTTFTQLVLKTYNTVDKIINPAPTSNDGRTGGWNGSKTHYWTVDFGGTTVAEKIAAARYFFNAGGEIVISGTYTPSVNDQNQSPEIDWSWSAIYAGWQTFTLRARSCFISGNAVEATASPTSSNTTYTRLGGGNQGFYNLGTSYSPVLRVDPPTATAYDSYIYYNLDAKFDTATGLLNFQVTLVDTYDVSGTAWGYNEKQSGGVLSRIQTKIPQGKDASNNNTVFLPDPVITAVTGTFDL